MATTLTVSTCKVEFRGSLVTDTTLAPANISLALSLALTFAQGTGAGNANKIYIARRTLAATLSENLDLAAVLTDPLTTVLSFTKVRAIIFALAASPAAGPLLVGGHATAAFRNWITGSPDMDTAQPKIRIGNGPAGGVFMLTRGDATGFATTATTEDMLKVENEHATLTATYDVAIIGE